ncbi:hypothetical protein B0H14DRAFT_3167472 [Mycena olivaceomarginata]|nr:hypothetical protein B0H14DRAFT_3167472 [Mycena olivaceomarginata]
MSRSSILPIFESIVHRTHKSRSSTTSYGTCLASPICSHKGSSQAARNCPIIDGATLPIFDVFIIPTSCGDFPDRKAFRDSNGPISTVLLLTPRGLAHHGIIFVPLRCASTLDQFTVLLAAVIYMSVRLEFPIILYPSLVLRSHSP